MGVGVKVTRVTIHIDTPPPPGRASLTSPKVTRAIDWAGGGRRGGERQQRLVSDIGEGLNWDEAELRELRHGAGGPRQGWERAKD